MRDALVIAAREFEEKRFVAYAALAFAILPFLVGVIPMVNGKSPGSTIVMMAVVLATGFTIGLGVITGASFIGRDLSDGRMSFYFSRPVGSMSIWFGKLAAGIVLIVGCFGVIAAPARFFGPAWRDTWSLTFSQLAGTVLTIAVALFLIAHVIGTIARSRSPLIVADFAAAVICGVSIRLLLLPLFRGFAINLINGLLITLAIALVVAIIGGGAWQLARGRTDRRRSHLALSQFLWSTMAIALILAAGFVAWVVSAKPSDLTGAARVSYVTGSPFLAISGQARNRGDYNAAYLIDVVDGSSRNIDARNMAIHFTRDGASVMVTRLEDNIADVVVFKHGVAKPIETGLTIPASFAFFVSDDGNRIATLGNESLSVFDVAQKRSLISVRGPADGKGFYRGIFVNPDLLRLYIQARGGLSIFELDVRARTLKLMGSIAATGYLSFALDPDASRMLIHRNDTDEITLNDARTGAVIKVVASTRNDVLLSRFLRDGRMAIVEGPPSNATLHLLSSDGTLLREFHFDAGSERLSYLGDDGTRMVLSAWNTLDPGPRSITSINLDSGIVERTERGPFVWAMTSSYWDSRPPLLPLREVFYGDNPGRIVAWNPATGAKRMIARGTPPSRRLAWRRLAAKTGFNCQESKCTPPHHSSNCTASEKRTRMVMRHCAESTSRSAKECSDCSDRMEQGRRHCFRSSCSEWSRLLERCASTEPTHRVAERARRSAGRSDFCRRTSSRSAI
jgi:hypothetical protein